MISMKEIPEFLERFKRILYSHEATQKILSEAVYECLNLEIEPDHFLVRGDSVHVSCDSVVKNEILINNDKILDSFYKKGGSKSISKIN
ncbi:MAG: hypothetical protein ACQESA_01875 [Patescibacteria group bacterium]